MHRDETGIQFFIMPMLSRIFTIWLTATVFQALHELLGQ
jgi:hypothetical protein